MRAWRGAGQDRRAEATGQAGCRRGRPLGRRQATARGTPGTGRETGLPSDDPREEHARHQKEHTLDFSEKARQASESTVSEVMGALGPDLPGPCTESRLI